MRLNSTAKFLFLAPMALMLPVAAQASCAAPSTNFFSLTATVGAGCGSFGTNTAEAFLDELKTSGLSTISGISYTGVEAASISANFNKLPISLAFPNTGSTGSGAVLTFAIPALGVNQTFQGATRDDSRDQLKDYLKKNDIIGKIMKYQAENSPYSPIAGPGGLIPTQAAASFDDNFTNTATNIAAPASAAATGGKSTNLAGVALSYGSLNVADSSTKVTTLPLSYTIRNDIDPRRQLVISLPITQIDANGAKSYEAGLGVAYRVPMSDQWTLTPGVKLGVTGSKDLATLAAVSSGTITSTYIWELPNFDVALGNQVGYYKTMKVGSGDYSADPGITSTTFRNGVMLSQPVSFGGQKMSLEYSLIDTRYTGSKFYVDNTQEISITLGTNKRAFSARSFFRGGLTFLHGKDTSGVTANFGYWF